MTRNGYAEAFSELSASESRIFQFRMEHPGATQEEIAAGVRLSLRQVSRLMTREPLQNAFANFSRHVLTAAVEKIKASSLVAVQTLVEIAQKAKAKDADRIQASRALLSTLDGIGALLPGDDDDDEIPKQKQVLFVVNNDDVERFFTSDGAHEFRETNSDGDDLEDDKPDA